jgi:hypothetical protein
MIIGDMSRIFADKLSQTGRDQGEDPRLAGPAGGGIARLAPAPARRVAWVAGAR